MKLKIFNFFGILSLISWDKTQTFYEFILVDTDSVAIKHFRDINDESLITHSTFQILRVLRPSDFDINPSKIQKFSKCFDPIGFNYWDYVRAWENCILGLQNKNLKHSWLFYFKKSTKYSFPNWFHSWWDLFGPTTNILPPDVQKGFKYFSKNWNKDLNNYHIVLNFFSIFSLSWVFSWQYKIKKTGIPIPELHKQALIKWWSSFDASSTSIDNLKTWFRDNQRCMNHASPQSSLLLNQKAHISAALAGASCEDDLMRSLQKALSLLQESSINKKASSSKGHLPKNDKHQMPSSSDPVSSVVSDTLEENSEGNPDDLC